MDQVFLSELAGVREMQDRTNEAFRKVIVDLEKRIRYLEKHIGVNNHNPKKEFITI